MQRKTVLLLLASSLAGILVVALCPIVRVQWVGLVTTLLCYVLVIAIPLED